MRRYHNKPHNKPPRPPKTKTAPRPSPEWFDGVVGSLFGFFGALVGARLLLAALAAMPAIAAVGDRIPIGPASMPAGLTAPDIIVHEVTDPAAAAGPACRLNLAIMKHPGGVFSVLAVRPDGIVLSWAGGPTARGEDACATANESILVALNDYSLLLKRQSLKH
jgi:hypothetical protein